MHPNTDIEWLTKECAKTRSLRGLAAIALKELQKFTAGAEMVCGPISTGGRGSAQENLRVFNAAIKALQQNERPIFSQMPYEDCIFLFRKRWQAKDISRANQYYLPILEQFYRPLMRSGILTRGWFIPGWESSLGARWERAELAAAGIEICDLNHAWIDNALDAI